MSIPSGRVAAIWRYPVKSLAGESIDEAIVTPRGLLGARAYALLDEETGRVASAKNPRRWPGLLHHRAEFPQPPRPGEPLPPARITLQDGTVLRTDDPDANARLSTAVGRPVHLVTAFEEGAPSQGYRPNYEWLPHRDEVFDYRTPPGTFFDGAMVHLVTTATLLEVARLAPESQIEPARFRPNFLIETNENESGFVENDWLGRTLAFGEVILHIDRPCPRCVITTVPQGHLPADPRVLRAAVQGNRGSIGVYASVLQGGTVHRGDAVTLDARV